MRSSPLVKVCGLLCLALLSSCVHRTGVGGTKREEPFPERPTVEVRKEPAADEALAAAVEEAGPLPPAEAAKRLLEVRRAFPRSTAGQDALYRAGVLFFEMGDFARARETLRELLFENPLHLRADDAKLKLGHASYELGEYRDAYQTLASLADRMDSGEGRRQVLAAAGRAAAAGELYGPALRIAIAIADEARTLEEQQRALEEVVDLIEGRVPFLEVAKIHQDLPETNPAWPIVSFKLARIYYHLRDWSRLEQTLQRFLQVAPGHPFAPRAEELLARATRLPQVRPRVVGVILPMSGRYQALGEAVLRGIRLALEESDVTLVVKDSQGDVNLTGRAVEELVFDEQAIGIIGPLLAEGAQRAALVAEELQVPLLTLTRTDDITAIGPHIFRNMLTSSAQARALAEYATRTLGYRSFAVLYPNIPYGVELANAFWDEVLARGGEIRGAESYAHDQTTFATEVKKLVGRYYLKDRPDYEEQRQAIMKETEDPFRRRRALERLQSSLEPVIDFDAILLPDDWRRVSLVAPALAVEDIVTNACDPRDLERIRKTTGREDLKTVTLLGTNQWGSSPRGRTGLPELIERGGKFVACSIYVDGFYAESERQATRAFVARFKRSFPEPQRDPNFLEAIGFDSAGIIRHLLERRAPKSRQELREGLSGLRDFDGATGRTTINERREAEKTLFFLTIDSKGLREISPDTRIGGT